MQEPDVTPHLTRIDDQRTSSLLAKAYIGLYEDYAHAHAIDGVWDRLIDEMDKLFELASTNYPQFWSGYVKAQADGDPNELALYVAVWVLYNRFITDLEI